MRNYNSFKDACEAILATTESEAVIICNYDSKSIDVYSLSNRPVPYTYEYLIQLPVWEVSEGPGGYWHTHQIIFENNKKKFVSAILSAEENKAHYKGPTKEEIHAKNSLTLAVTAIILSLLAIAFQIANLLL